MGHSVDDAAQSIDVGQQGDVQRRGIRHYKLRVVCHRDLLVVYYGSFTNGRLGDEITNEAFAISRGFCAVLKKQCARRLPLVQEKRESASLEKLLAEIKRQ